VSTEEPLATASFRMDGARAVIEDAPAALQIQHQVEAIEEAMDRRPAMAFDMAKTLIETTCKTVLNDRAVTFDAAWDCPKLLKETFKQLHLVPSDHATAGGATDALRKVGNGLATTVQGLCELRSQEGVASHGKDAFVSSLGAVQAELAARAADAVVRFLWSVHRDGQGVGAIKRLRYEELQDFNDWIDTVAHEAPLQIFQTDYQQSEVLFKIDLEAYRNAMADFEEYKKENPA
jgi:hypothetical protein